MKKRKKYTKKTNYLQNVQSDITHTVETMHKIVSSLRKLFTWYFEVEHLLALVNNIYIICTK